SADATRSAAVAVRAARGPRAAAPLARPLRPPAAPIAPGTRVLAAAPAPPEARAVTVVRGLVVDASLFPLARAHVAVHRATTGTASPPRDLLERALVGHARAEGLASVETVAETVSGPDGSFEVEASAPLLVSVRAGPGYAGLARVDGARAEQDPIV